MEPPPPSPTSAPPPEPGDKPLERKPARHLTLLAFAAITLSFVAVPGYGAGPILGVILLAISLVLRRRGYDVRRPIAAAISAFVISALSAGACQLFFLRPAEVSGADERRQDRVEERFERAFETSEAPPPPRRSREERPADASTLDAGAGFGDDAGSAATR
jgi:hypothetical protein